MDIGQIRARFAACRFEVVTPNNSVRLKIFFLYRRLGQKSLDVTLFFRYLKRFGRVATHPDTASRMFLAPTYATRVKLKKYDKSEISKLRTGLHD